MLAIKRARMSGGIEGQYGKSLPKGVISIPLQKQEERSAEEERNDINTQTNGW